VLVKYVKHVLNSVYLRQGPKENIYILSKTHVPRQGSQRTEKMGTFLYGEMKGIVTYDMKPIAETDF
jgi:hypothetical protein